MYGLLSVIIHLPRMFQRTDFLFGKRIGLDTMDLIYIIFT